MVGVNTNDGELTAAELLTFGILPPEPDKPKPVEHHKPETSDKPATVPTFDDQGVSKRLGFNNC
jgi:hypothetical protein